MNASELRLECLRLAADMKVAPHQLTKSADEFFSFVLNGTVPEGRTRPAEPSQCNQHTSTESTLDQR